MLDRIFKKQNTNNERKNSKKNSQIQTECVAMDLMDRLTLPSCDSFFSLQEATGYELLLVHGLESSEVGPALQALVSPG